MSNSPFSPGDQVAGYFRDSGGDEQDLSVDRQLAEFRSWLEDNQLREGSIFVDKARPGSSTIGRVGFQDMISHFRSGLADEKGLAIWRSNRFSRNADDSQFYKADIRRRGYQIHSLTDKIPQDRYGQIIEYLLDWKDQDFLESLSEDVTSGLHHIVETYGAMPGIPPRGFKREPVNIGNRRDGKPHILHRWVPDPSMSPLVRRAFSMLLDGASLANIQTVTGLYNSLNSFITFFRNPLYKGELHYKDLVIENYCEAIVDPAVWERAQLLLRKRAGRSSLHGSEHNPEAHPRRMASPWLLSGIARCARCNSPLNVHVLKNYTYYRCSRAVRNRDCDAINIPAGTLELEVIEHIRDLLSDPDALAAAQQRQFMEFQEAASEFPARRKEIVTRLENLRRQISRLADAVAEHGHSAALLEKLTALETQEYELKDEQAQIDILLRSQPEAINPQRIQRLTQQFDLLLVTGTPDQKRQALAGWIYRLDVDRIDKKRILVGLDIFIPPYPGPDPPRKNIGLRIVPPWGHQINPPLSGGFFMTKLMKDASSSGTMFEALCPI